jgi:hypothetical protein
MAINYATLKTELQTDPRGYGYAEHLTTGNDAALAGMLNTVRDGTNGTAITIRRPTVGRFEILDAIDVRDFPATPGQVNNATLAASWFESITQADTVRLANPDGSKTQTRKNIDRLVGDTNGSQTRLDAVAIKNGSRAEELFGALVTVSSDDIAKALRG